MKQAQLVFIGQIAMATPRDTTAAALIVVPLARTERYFQLDGVSFYLSPALVPWFVISLLCPVSRNLISRGYVLHGLRNYSSKYIHLASVFCIDLPRCGLCWTDFDKMM